MYHIYHILGVLTAVLIIVVIIALSALIIFLWNTFVCHRPLKNKRYRSLPLLSAKGKVLSCSYLADGLIGSPHRIILEIADNENSKKIAGELIFVYITPLKDRQKHDELFNLEKGDEGILYYRKGRRVNYFADFERTLAECKGVVSQKVTHKFLASLRDEYILFDSQEGEQIKVYVEPLLDSQERIHLDSFSEGDVGILHYFKGKRNKFVKFEPISVREANS
jgi:hypothetical protein